MFRGPLPPPAILRGYEALKPGTASRIIGWVENESEHRRDLERRQQAWDNWKDVTGMGAAFVLTAGIIAVGAYLLLHDKQIGGIVALVGALVPLAGAFYLVHKIGKDKK